LRCVFDTSVLVSALLINGSKPRKAFDFALGNGKILLSSSVLLELYEVLGRKRFRHYINEEDTRRFLAALTRETEWIEIDLRIEACRDPKDDKFLELAVCGSADYLVTGDDDLIALHPFRGIQIFTPNKFLESLDH
jgi:putative PIN family toxin of toxin-antitoxin system